MSFSLTMEETNELLDIASDHIGDEQRGFIIPAKGSEMEKAGIYSGDYLLFTPDREPENGDIVYLDIYDQAMYRRIFFEQALPEKKACVRIRREDGYTPDLVADESDVLIKAVFEGLIRNQSRRKSRKDFRFLTPAQAEQEAVHLEKSRGKTSKWDQSDSSQLPGSNIRRGDPSVSISHLSLPARILNLLTGIGMHTVQDVLDIPDKEALLAIPGLGKSSYEQILHCLEREGFDSRHLCW